MPPSLPLHPPSHPHTLSHPHPPSHPPTSHTDGGSLTNRVSMRGSDDVEAAAHGALPGFRWKLVVLGHRPFDESTPPTPPAALAAHTSPLQRYRGVYKDNNTLTIFRDVISVDKTTFPLALRISMAPLPATNPPVTGLLLGGGEGGSDAPPPSSSSASQNNNSNNNNNETNDDDNDHYNYHKSHPPINVAEELMFVVRLFRKDDRQLVSETRARGVAQLYNLPLADFLPPPGTVTAADAVPATTAAGGKAAAAPAAKGKPPAKGAAAVKAVESQELIIECCIDEEVVNDTACCSHTT